MGALYGIVNIVVAIWFYSSAVSVKKSPFTWAIIGALSFLALKFGGYWLISIIQGSIETSGLDTLVDQGYVVTDDSAENLASETKDSGFLGIFYEFLPLICALLGTAFLRAKFILQMGFVESLKHKTPLQFETINSDEITENLDDQSLDAKVMAKIKGFFNKDKS